MSKDVVLNKVATIQKCLKRIEEEYGEDFESNYTKQDSVILNLERASQATIDIATHIIRDKKLGLPNTSRELFVILDDSDMLSKEISIRMQAMVGFRNIAVHDYQNLNIEIVKSIVQNHLDDFEAYCEEVFTNYLNS